MIFYIIQKIQYLGQITQSSLEKRASVWDTLQSSVKQNAANAKLVVKLYVSVCLCVVHVIFHHHSFEWPYETINTHLGSSIFYNKRSTLKCPTLAFLEPISCLSFLIHFVLTLKGNNCCAFWQIVMSHCALIELRNCWWYLQHLFVSHFSKSNHLLQTGLWFCLTIRIMSSFVCAFDGDFHPKISCHCAAVLSLN